MRTRFASILLALLAALSTSAQERYTIVSYNVENLFDCQNDSLTNDDEYTPDGKRAWNYTKYQKKLARISKVIAAINEGYPPLLVGLCEIENSKVLTDLTRYSPLKAMNYKYVQFESPDKRGIDTGLLYQSTLFRPLHAAPLRVRFTQSPHSTTRDILYVKGLLLGADTLHVFVCHFPSRLGGELESEHKRCDAAHILKQCTDSISKSYELAKIVIMGDFNDYPHNRSIAQILQALQPVNDSTIAPTALYNLMARHASNPNIGTHKHQEEWGILDHIIVSGALLQNQQGAYTHIEGAHIFAPQFLLENDTKNLGFKPFRTYIGMKYNDGFSDHLPIYLQLNYLQP